MRYLHGKESCHVGSTESDLLVDLALAERD